MSLSVNSSNSTNPFASLQSLWQQATSPSATAASDPLSQLLGAIEQQTASSSTSSAAGSSGTAVSGPLLPLSAAGGSCPSSPLAGAEGDAGCAARLVEAMSVTDPACREGEAAEKRVRKRGVRASAASREVRVTQGFHFS